MLYVVSATISVHYRIQSKWGDGVFAYAPHAPTTGHGTTFLRWSSDVCCCHTFSRATKAKKQTNPSLCTWYHTIKALSFVAVVPHTTFPFATLTTLFRHQSISALVFLSSSGTCSTTKSACELHSLQETSSSCPTLHTDFVPSTFKPFDAHKNDTKKCSAFQLAHEAAKTSGNYESCSWTESGCSSEPPGLL
jgi:hypothetical protein